MSLRVKLRILTLMTAAEADSSVDADVDTLLSGLTRFLLLHSAEVWPALLMHRGSTTSGTRPPKQSR
jgi:hypothetical protein